ncbi:MAG: HypC/HybG/HupF family hydrogenase formation chaperone [Verrucomicrobiota bacterium]|nr:HypC/HybG/HupF family hydrogenase formation chaperone [Limisphaera sp.]MDW8382563.1 HypC/HybG/HupF family hydrogenase formation chaperone [Verrucomicrobiota bacterium]
MCLAVPGKLLSVAGEDPLERTGRVSFGGVIKDVSLACVPEAKPGDYVLVHVGLALSVVDEQEARQVFEYLQQMDELAELNAASPGASKSVPPSEPQRMAAS